ncbi:phosphoglycolate phosphatase [Deltaproteobacteria bacterium]|nr:phosphoglycolate phosphatase [Deltaproteobacteria bacterium]
MSRAVLWDLDGTLADTAADIALTVNELLDHLGLPRLAESRVRAFVGDGARSLIDGCVAAAGGAPAPAHVAWFMTRYRAFPCREARVYPGMADLVHGLDAPQAVVTNKPEAVSRALLAALGLGERLNVVIGGDTLPVRKPHPAPLLEAMAQLGATTAVMIGDGPHDVHGARAAGVPVIGVDWGIGRPDGADVRVADAPALAEALARYGVGRYR